MTDERVKAAIDAILPKLEAVKKYDALWRDKDNRSFRLAVLLGGTDLSKEGNALLALAEHGDADADLLLRQISAKLIARGHPLPPEWREYVAGMVRTGKIRRTAKAKTGPSRYRNNIRDSFIVMIVADVCQYGFEPTRNIATADMGGTESACSIVAQALETVGIPGGEALVNKIWRKRLSVGRIPARTRISP